MSKYHCAWEKGCKKQTWILNWGSCTLHHAVGNGLLPSTQKHIQQIYQQRGVTEHSDSTVTAVNDDHIVLDDGTTIDCDLVIWATDAIAPPSA